MSKKGLFLLFALIFTNALSAFCDCKGWLCRNCETCRSFEVGFGWRRDDLQWKLNDVEQRSELSCSESYVPLFGRDSMDDKICFDDINLYTANAKARWVGNCFYVRLDADYARSDKGRAREHFNLNNTVLPSVDAFLDNHIKRYCEFYDFKGAVGYPFLIFCRHLEIVPLIGFSYDRQRIVVKDEDKFIPCYLNEFDAVDYGFFKHCRCSSNYRFTWYGGLIGADLAYGFDGIWTLWGEFEYHFGRCHRKRHSNLGSDVIDEYHFSGNAHGFEGTIGATVVICSDWYLGFYVDARWWESHDHNDKLDWNSVAANASIGYQF